MVDFLKYELKNGLKLIFHKDISTPMAAINILYQVGARNEDEDKTGYAHLFEHLMFSGSKHIPEFDEPLQMVGGEDNAFTTNDLTNYHIVLPKDNIETAFWLESDRMLELAFTKKGLDVQKNVVIEEFKERYLNQPYGDVWLHFRPLAYTVHPYKWATIGKDIAQIEKATIKDLKDFFYSHYAPNNAIMAVTGNFEFPEVIGLVEKWFGDIPTRPIKTSDIPLEPAQTAMRTLTLTRDVPYDAIYIGYHMCNRLHDDYYVFDLLSDVLSNGNSARLYQRLVKEQNLFTDLDAYISGDFDEGLFVISGKLVEGVTMADAENAIYEQLRIISDDEISEYELEKVKNKVEANYVFSEMNGLNKAINLCYYEWLGDANLINTEIERYRVVTANQIKTAAKHTFVPQNASVLYYYAAK